MNPGKSRCVYRYFDPADSFVRIQVCDGSNLELPAPSGLNRASYRRLVIQTCMPDFKGDLANQLEQLFPEDPLLAEDLLYQLCTEVNPGLDINTVRIRGEEGAPAPATAPEAVEEDAYERFLERLRRATSALGRRLNRRIVGQDAAVESVVRAVEKSAAGLAARGRPLGTFMFVGRTGTGKTELARVLSQELFAENGFRGLVRIDCSEFALAHEYSKLIGAPPGYVGHEDGGQLTEQVARHPETVVLFDEIEKAHPRMHNLLLQILEDGILTDGRGRRVSFERSLILLTSNVGASDIVTASRTIGFDRMPQELGTASLRDITFAALEQQFSPEFLGRLDEIVVFRELDLRAARNIAQRQLTDLAARARMRGVRVAFTPAVARWVAQSGFSREFGAREVKRVIQRTVEAPLSQFILELPREAEGLIRARMSGGKLTFELEP